ncbi:Pfam:Inhibitor PI31 [Geosmithia morbida]|uniref:Pfam:Inhibitor PI31 n=1 Tax=Geosmithia morbida TaxID=1094350 RepID=A0A9P4Z0K5_9HYPO|nr:Pfam:Inhibitor PI31 [Geosmithia morbida]KAF4126488.1 Pfam:Inhibitor PI31 [Geosmithia morbida]
MSKLSPDSMLRGMADALSTHPPGDEGPDLASSYEVVALLVHAYLSAIGFKLRGFDEEKSLPEAESLAPRLPPSWNDRFGALSFVYSHKQSSMTFVVRVDRMGSKVEVRGLAVGDEKIYRFERPIRDVVQSRHLPFRIPITDDGQEDRSGVAEKLRSLFASESAISSLVNDLKVQIVQRLVPKLQSEDYIEETAETEATALSERRAQESRNPNHPFAGGAANQPHQPLPNPGLLPDLARPRPAPTGDFPVPDFDDEHQMLQRPGTGRPFFPYNIGHDDLNPPGLGPHDPLRGSFAPTGGLRGPGVPGGYSGMHPTFDDPLFTGQGSGMPGGGQRGGYNSQAPPGARWDPLGPGGNPRFPGPGSGGNFGPFGPGGGGII